MDDWFLHVPIPVLVLFLLACFPTTAPAQQSLSPPPPQLDQQHFIITALQENGFLDMHDDDNNNPEQTHSISYSGYLIDMLQAIARLDRANFTYELRPPSGFGSLCQPRLTDTTDDTNNNTINNRPNGYSPQYRTQYNCGASDVNDGSDTHYASDFYLGMYYVTPSRQLQNQFTIPFLPPFSGTLTMFGTATGIRDFDDLVVQQRARVQGEACAPGGTALLGFVQQSYPEMRIKGVFGGEDDIYQYFLNNTCQVYIVDGPVAAQFVLRRSQRNQCLGYDDMPIGIIGQPMSFGLSHYAIGIGSHVPRRVTDTLSYWMNILMSCNPLDENGPCPDGNLASFYKGQGGTGTECGYVLYPSTSDQIGAGTIAGIVVASVIFVFVVYTCFHRYRIGKQQRKFQKRAAITEAQAHRERELNEFIAHEVRNPLASAIAALSFVSSKTGDPEVVPNSESRASINSDLSVIDSSLQFVNELLRNMLDLHRSANGDMKLRVSHLDILQDVFEPVVAILFMRGAKVEVVAECPKNLIVDSDRMRLKQIFLNLAANSTKFVQSGYIKLRAEVKDGMVWMYCEDSGPGIPESKRGMLFNKFQESLDLLNQGTGIGLSVCKNLSRLLGAELYHDESFHSGIPDCPGTRFVLQLNQKPLDVDTDRASLYDSESSVKLERELPDEMKVLFIDDDMMIRKMFTRTLKRVAPAWDIRQASNGETGLRCAEEEEFELIFVDQYMSSIEKQLLGTETVRLLRSRGVNSIICGLSANDKEQEFLEAGANSFWTKPWAADMKAALLSLLDPSSKACRVEAVPGETKEAK